MNISYVIYKIISRVLLILSIAIPFSMAKNILEPGIYVIDNAPIAITPLKKMDNDYYLQSSKYFKVPQMAPNIQYAIVSKNLDNTGYCENDCHNKIFFISNNTPSIYQIYQQYKNPESTIKEMNTNICSGIKTFNCVKNYDKNRHSLLKNNQSICQSYENLPSPSEPYASTLHKAFCFGLEYKTKKTLAITTKDNKVYFTLKQPLPYQTILYTNHRISLYTEPTLSADKQIINEKSYLAILKQTADWYEVDYYSANKDKQHGWVNRDDFIVGEWIPQEAKRKRYKFEAALYDEGQYDYGGTNSYSAMIRVIDRNNNNIRQTLRDLVSDRTPEQDDNDTKKNMVELIDVNFDGHLDMVTHTAEEGMQQPVAIGVFLYQPTKHRFIESKTLAWVDKISINKKLKIVDVVHWEGKTDRFEYKYQFINHKQILIYSSEIMGFFDYSEETIGHLINGKMHYKTTRDNYNKDDE